MEAIWHFLGCASIEKADRAVKDASDMLLDVYRLELSYLSVTLFHVLPSLAF